MTREWQPGDPIPEHYSGMSVTFAWNDVALTAMLRTLRVEYPSGYRAMVDAVREAMRTYTPPRPDEPLLLGAVIEDEHGNLWVRAGEHADDDQPWRNESLGWKGYDDIAGPRVLSPGYDPEATP